MCLLQPGYPWSAKKLQNHDAKGSVDKAETLAVAAAPTPRLWHLLWLWRLVHPSRTLLAQLWEQGVCDEAAPFLSVSPRTLCLQADQSEKFAAAGLADLAS